MAHWPRSKTAEELKAAAKPSDDWLAVFTPPISVSDEVLEAEERHTPRKELMAPEPEAPPKRAKVRKVDTLELEEIRAAFREAVPDARTPFDYLDELDRRLMAAGWPATSDWWKAALRRFYGSSCTQLVLRVGRRGGKSSTLCRLAVLEALMGDHRVAPGDTAVVAIISVRKEDAKERLTTIDAILAVLQLDYKSLAERIDLTDAPIAFRVFAATVSGVSGFTSVCVICDEVSKWIDKDAGRNPAGEVLASVRPTMAGVASARIFLSSSPMKPNDAHARAFDEGDSAPGDGFQQQVAFAETWVARPALTIEDTRRLEPDHRRWLREYGAVPMEDADDGLFTAVLLDSVTRPVLALTKDRTIRQYVAAMGVNLTRNTWTLVIAARRHDGTRIRRSILACYEWRSPDALEPAAILPQIVEHCVAVGAGSVYCNPEGAAIVNHPAARGMSVHLVQHARLLDSAIAMLARICDGEDELPPDPLLRQDLLALRVVDTPNGKAIRLPDPQETRRADLALPAVLALDRCLVDPSMPDRPRSEAEYWEREEQRARERDFRQVAVRDDWLEQMADDFHGS